MDWLLWILAEILGFVADYLGWILVGGIIITVCVATWNKGNNLNEEKHKPSEEYYRIYRQIDTMSLSELKKLESQLSDYGVYAGPLWSWREPEWELEDYERARNKIIENGPICGCVTYGEAADMYEKAWKTRINKM